MPLWSWMLRQDSVAKCPFNSELWPKHVPVLVLTPRLRILGGVVIPQLNLHFWPLVPMLVVHLWDRPPYLLLTIISSRWGQSHKNTLVIKFWEQEATCLSPLNLQEPPLTNPFSCSSLHPDFMPGLTHTRSCLSCQSFTLVKVRELKRKKRGNRGNFSSSPHPNNYFIFTLRVKYSLVNSPLPFPCQWWVSGSFLLGVGTAELRINISH